MVVHGKDHIAAAYPGLAGCAIGILYPDPGRDVVFVLRDRRVERRAVTVAGNREGDVVLNAGLSAGERIVVAPPAGLADGAAVTEGKL